MRFRPCIDIHNGTVKQIVGGSLQDEGNSARTNYISDRSADFYARMYSKTGFGADMLFSSILQDQSTMRRQEGRLFWH